MYCNQCGKQIPDDAKFCQECGCKTNSNHQELNSKNHIEQTETNKKSSVTSANPNISVQKPTTTRCQKCQAIYPADMQFCPTCGANDPKDVKSTTSQSNNSKIAMPNKPVFSKGFLIYEIVACVLLILMFNSNPPALILELFCFVVLPAIIYLPIYFKCVDNYNLANTNPEAYHQKLKDEAKAAYARAEAERIRQKNAPKCPMCNSTNIERITTMDRSVSIAMVGLASGKIGKQYKCKNCKHMW